MLIGQCMHPFDLLDRLGGDAPAIQAMFRQVTETNLVYAVNLEFRSGASGHPDLNSLNVRAPFRDINEVLEVVGHETHVTCEDMLCVRYQPREHWTAAAPHAGRSEPAFGPSWTDIGRPRRTFGYTGEVRHFARRCLGLAADGPDLWDGYEALRLAEAVYEAAHGGRDRPDSAPHGGAAAGPGGRHVRTRWRVRVPLRGGGCGASRFPNPRESGPRRRPHPVPHRSPPRRGPPGAAPVTPLLPRVGPGPFSARRWPVAPGGLRPHALPMTVPAPPLPDPGWATAARTSVAVERRTRRCPRPERATPAPSPKMSGGRPRRGRTRRHRARARGRTWGARPQSARSRTCGARAGMPRGRRPCTRKGGWAGRAATACDAASRVRPGDPVAHAALREADHGTHHDTAGEDRLLHDAAVGHRGAPQGAEGVPVISGRGRVKAAVSLASGWRWKAKSSGRSTLNCGAAPRTARPPPRGGGGAAERRPTQTRDLSAARTRPSPLPAGARARCCGTGSRGRGPGGAAGPDGPPPGRWPRPWCRARSRCCG